MVYNPTSQELQHLNDPNTHPLGPLLLNYEDLSFLGEKLDSNLAQ
jgi:hypothetical protein